MRWTITKKIGGLAGVLIFFIMCLLIHSIFILRGIERELFEIATYDVPLSKMAAEIEIKQLEQHILVRQLSQTRRGNPIQDTQERLLDIAALIRSEADYSTLITERIQQSLLLIKQGLDSSTISDSSKEELMRT